MDKNVDVLQAINTMIKYLQNNPDIYMIRDNPYFPLARAWILDDQVGSVLRGRGPIERV